MRRLLSAIDVVQSYHSGGRMNPRLCVAVIACTAVFLSCGKKSTSIEQNSAIVALSGDVENFNPIVASSVVSTEINSVVFPNMFTLTFDEREGRLQYGPGLVRSWDFSPDGLDVTLHLRSDVRWEDGMPVTAEDVKFSYALYGDPKVASPRSNYVESMIMTDGVFDPEKSMTVIDDSTIVFHFAKKYQYQIFHLNLSPIPKHLYRNADPATLRANPMNDTPVGSGPFKVEKWTRQQEVILGKNARNKLTAEAALDRVVFRVIEEPTTRLTELKKGTLDFMWPVYQEDVKDIQANSRDIRLVTRPPRAYEYLNWANIDFEEYKKSNGKTLRPHRLFGDRRVRQALTFGINRKAIMDAKLGTYGELAVTDISPIFRWAVNNELVPYAYDPNKARELFKAAGWTDSNGDGVLDREGVKFEFTLHYNTGNPRRAYAATVIQDNLRQLGIIVNLAPIEPVVFYEAITSKKYDAFLGGFSISLVIDPSDRWGDIHNPFNTTGFQNERVTELLKLGLHAPNDREAGRFWKEIQAILHQEQPCTFMYWVKDIVGVNRRLKNTNVTMLGILDEMWEWKLGDPNAAMTN